MFRSTSLGVPPEFGWCKEDKEKNWLPIEILRKFLSGNCHYWSHPRALSNGSFTYVGVPRHINNLPEGYIHGTKVTKEWFREYATVYSFPVLENFHLVLLETTCSNFPENEHMYLLFADVSYYFFFFAQSVLTLRSHY